MKKSGIFVFVFTFTIVMCAMLFRPQYMNFSKKAFGNITTNMKKLADNFYATTNRTELLEENERLKKELSYKNSYIDENKLLRQENDNLYKMLSLTKRSPHKKQIAANVTGINTLGKFTITIDRGKNQGINKGTVAVWGDALVGKVCESFDDFSYISPVSAPDNVTGIISETEDAGLVTGKPELYQKNMCELSFFLNGAKALGGSTITTSGLSDTYPKGLIVGKVYKKNGMVLIKTEVDFFKIRTLSLIISE